MAAVKSVTEFCPQCQDLEDNLQNAELADIIPASGWLIVNIGHPLEENRCVVCRCFLAHAPQYKRKYSLQVRLFDRAFGTSSSSATPERYLSVIRQNGDEHRYHKNEVARQGVFLFAPRDTATSSKVSLLNETLVDYQYLQFAIRQCKESHHTYCRQTLDPDQLLPYIKLIDCINCRIIRGDLNMTYLALSYVWGQSTSTSTRQGDETELQPESVPSTVRDAIQVVKNLGMQYLWVDRYCISQDDSQERALMINRMDQIYERAEATIVAAWGESDEAGLPGVSVPRRPQPRVQTTQWQFISTCPPIGTILDLSTWATRGWTFQEARLSRRCLFFTEHQVYVVCRNATTSEVYRSSSLGSPVSSLINSGSLLQLSTLPDSYISKITGTLFVDRHLYSQKRLTREHDILDAFRGILWRSSFVSFWGVTVAPLPVKMDANLGFAMGLLWCRRPSWTYSAPIVLGPASNISTSTTRRSGFPTWSWTSATGEIFHDGDNTSESVFGAYLQGITRQSNHNHANVSFSVFLRGDYINLNNAVSNYPFKLIPEDTGSERLLVEGDIVRLNWVSGECRIHGLDHLDLSFKVSFDMKHGLDIFSEGEEKDALVLLDWNDNQKPTQRRFVMMLLEWAEEGVAERRGLVSDYRSELSVEMIIQIPRTRRTFVLT